MAFREASPLRQRLPYQGQRRRPPPVAETGSRCWGSGQQDASEAPRMPGAATRVRSTSGVTVRPMLDEQSFFILKTAVPCYRGQQLQNNVPCQAAANLCSRALFFAFIELSAGSRKLPGLPRAPPLGATATTAASGGNREELLGPRPAGCERQRSRRWEPQPGQCLRSRLRGLHHQTPQRRRDEPISIPAPRRAA